MPGNVAWQGLACQGMSLGMLWHARACHLACIGMPAGHVACHALACQGMPTGSRNRETNKLIQYSTTNELKLHYVAHGFPQNPIHRT